MRAAILILAMSLPVVVSAQDNSRPALQPPAVRCGSGAAPGNGDPAAAGAAETPWHHGRLHRRRHHRRLRARALRCRLRQQRSGPRGVLLRAMRLQRRRCARAGQPWRTGSRDRPELSAPHRRHSVCPPRTRRRVRVRPVALCPATDLPWADLHPPVGQQLRRRLWFQRHPCRASRPRSSRTRTPC